MAGGITWHYVLKFIITGLQCQLLLLRVTLDFSHHSYRYGGFVVTGDAAVGKSSLLIRLTDQRFLANPDPTVNHHVSNQMLSGTDCMTSCYTFFS